MRSPGRERTVFDLTKSNADDTSLSVQQTDTACSTNEFPEAMSQPQPPFLHDDDVDPTNDSGYLSSTRESHTSKDSSDSSSSFSSLLHPSNMTKDSSVLLQGLHDSYPHHHLKQDTTQYLFQNLSLSDNTKSDTSKPMTRRKLSPSRLPTSPLRSGSKREMKIKKPVSRQKRTRSKFRYYRHLGAIATITSAIESLKTPNDVDTKGSAPVNGLDNSLVIRLKYKTLDTVSSKMTPQEHDIDSSTTQPQRGRHQDIMRITSILNDDPTPSMSSPPSPCFDSPFPASNDDASPSPQQALSLNLPDRQIEHSSYDILDRMFDNDNNNNNNAHTQFAKAGLRDEYIRQFTNPERQRYEDALVEIVGDLELPFLGGRFGSGG